MYNMAMAISVKKSSDYSVSVSLRLWFKLHMIQLAMTVIILTVIMYANHAHQVSNHFYLFLIGYFCRKGAKS